MKKLIIIEGMSCGHCVGHVKEALAELNGVMHVEVDISSKTAVIEISENVSDQVIQAAIDDAGYEVVEIKAE